jgi:hypothetical protein
MRNKNLHSAKKSKNDEFYTRLEDIERELVQYKDHFRGKTIYCNCDDPRVSNFFKYFYVNFEKLGLKKLIASFYKDQTGSLITAKTVEKPFWVEYSGKKKL